ncbi:unnamed protein product, partial [Chrysoparadoxa australica]
AELEEKVAALTLQSAALQQQLRSARTGQKVKLDSLQRTVTSLRARGDLHDALAVAKEELSAAKLEGLRREGEANMYKQLLEV